MDKLLLMDKIQDEKLSSKKNQTALVCNLVYNILSYF